MQLNHRHTEKAGTLAVLSVRVTVFVGAFAHLVWGIPRSKTDQSVSHSQCALHVQSICQAKVAERALERFLQLNTMQLSVLGNDPMNLQTRLAMPKPKEHGAWGMLYVPLATATGVAGVVNWQVLLLTLTATLIFFSQRPYMQLLTNPSIRQDATLTRRHVSWLAVYWCASGVLVSLLYFHYNLTALPLFAWVGIPIAMAFTFFLKRNQMRSVPGQLTGICGLTLTAPLAHYAATGKVQPLGFWLWGLCILYFASSVFYVKALVAGFLRSRSKASDRSITFGRFCGFYHVGLLMLLAGLVVGGKIPALAMVAFSPVIVRGLLGTRRPESKLNFTRIGWTEVAYSVFFASLSILAMRLGA